MIVELREEACTQWASGWLAFQRRASRAFPGLDFNIQLSDEEIEESTFEAEVDAGAEMLPGPLDCSPLSDDLRVPPEASSSAPPASVGRGPSLGT